MVARSYLSIGEVLVSLKTEYPDITISKIRFLEGEGLIEPERTASGYRKFYEADVLRFRDLVSKGKNKILLNLADVTYIDSSGIGELVSAFTTVRNQSGELKLLKLTKKVHDLLQITKLYTVFDIKDDEAVAVQAFA